MHRGDVSHTDRQRRERRTPSSFVDELIAERRLAIAAQLRPANPWRKPSVLAAGSSEC